MVKKPSYGELEQRVKELEQILSERKHAEDELQKREATIQSVFDTTPVGICIMKNRVYQRVNRDWCESFGYPEENLIGRTTEFLYESHEEYERVGKELYRNLLKKGIAFGQARLKCSDGEFRDVDLIAKPLNPYDPEAGTVVVMHDITDHKKDAEALRESEERLRTITDSALDSIFCKDINRRYTFVNPSMIQLMECTKADLIGKVPEEVFDKEDAAIVTEVDERTLNGENISEVRSLSIAGKPYTFHTIQVPLRDSNGNITGISGIVRDITDFEQAQDALRESEERFRTVADFTYDWECWLAPDGQSIYVSPSCERITGYGPDEFVNDPELLVKIVHPDDNSIVVKHIRQEEQREEAYSLDFRIVTRSGEECWINHVCQPVYGAYGTYLGRRASNRDISKRKQAEEKLRLVSSSLLAAQERERKRISLELHDEVGQSLVVLKLQLRSIQGRLEEGQTELRSDCQAMLDYIVRLIENIRRICKDLTPGILDDLGLTTGIRWLVKNVLESHDIGTSKDIANIDSLFSNEQQLLVFRIFQEAFTNIVRHSLASHASIVIKKQGGEISFVIEDDGKGFDVKESMDRNFTERGMGLGAMEERARMLGGSVNIWSQRESGTRIDFRVPTE